MAGHLIVPDASPDDGMGDNRVGADEDQGVGELQILEGVAGSIIAIGTLVGDRCGGHAQTGIAVDVGLQIVAHDVSEDGKFLQGELTGTDAGNALSAVFCLQIFDLVGDMSECFVPADFLHGAVFLTDLGKRVRFYCGLLFTERKALDAAETVVDGIAFRRHCANDASVLHIEVEITVDRAEIAGRLYFLHMLLPFLCKCTALLRILYECIAKAERVRWSFSVIVYTHLFLFIYAKNALNNTDLLMIRQFY